MTNTELLAKIKTEIERRIALYSSLSENTVNPNRIDEDRQILSFLSTLESEKPMQEGLEEEISRYLREECSGDDEPSISEISRHFYDLGCRRTSEKYDEIEYNRQRAEEHLATSGKTISVKTGDEVTINGHKIVYDKDKDAITMEEIPNDLEEAADNHIRKVVDAAGHPGWDWTTQDIADAFIAGAKWQKEQMMKEAVGGEVKDFCFVREVNYSSAKIEFSTIPELKVGDKVRVIVLPKED